MKRLQNCLCYYSSFRILQIPWVSTEILTSVLQEKKRKGSCFQDLYFATGYLIQHYANSLNQMCLWLIHLHFLVLIRYIGSRIARYVFFVWFWKVILQLQGKIRCFQYIFSLYIVFQRKISYCKYKKIVSFRNMCTLFAKLAKSKY